VSVEENTTLSASLAVAALMTVDVLMSGVHGGPAQMLSVAVAAPLPTKPADERTVVASLINSALPPTTATANAFLRGIG
jgi:hypothetical protein